MLPPQQHSVAFDNQAVLVRPEVAQAQQPEPPVTELELTSDTGGDETPTLTVDVLRRFHGVVSLDSVRLKRDVDQIADAILQHLNSQPASVVEVALEIQAAIPEGATEELIRTISENARTLGFKSVLSGNRAVSKFVIGKWYSAKDIAGVVGGELQT